MAGHAKYEPRTALGRFVDDLEETVIAAILGIMVLLTFTNVVLRYVFNSLNIWSLEVVLILFSWLVLFGIAYGFKITAHLGVDAILNMCSPPVRRILAICAAVCSLAYAYLILKGAWDHWAPFAAMQSTSGHWIPDTFNPFADTHAFFNDKTRDRAFFETDQVPMLGVLRWMEDAINQGEAYSKLPRVVPYAILPISAALIFWRVVEVTMRIWNGEQDRMIVSHEAEDAVEEAARMGN